MGLIMKNNKQTVSNKNATNKEKIKKLKLKLKKAFDELKAHHKEYNKYCDEHDKKTDYFTERFEKRESAVVLLEEQIDQLTNKENPELKHAKTLLKNNGYKITK